MIKVFRESFFTTEPTLNFINAYFLPEVARFVSPGSMVLEKNLDHFAWIETTERRDKR